MKKITCFLLLLFFSFVTSQEKNVFDVARSGSVSEMEQFMNADPKIINTTNEMGFSPMILACYRGNVEVAKFLIDHVENINYESKEGTALAALSINYNKELVLKLLGKKANPNTKDSNGNTPLLWAIKRGNAELVKILLSFRADKNIKDNNGVSAFEHAVLTRNEEIINLLKNQ